MKIRKISFKEVVENNDPQSNFWQYMNKRMEETGVVKQIEDILNEGKQDDTPRRTVSRSIVH